MENKEAPSPASATANTATNDICNGESIKQKQQHSRPLTTTSYSPTPSSTNMEISSSTKTASDASAASIVSKESASNSNNSSAPTAATSIATVATAIRTTTRKSVSMKIKAVAGRKSRKRRRTAAGAGVGNTAGKLIMSSHPTTLSFSGSDASESSNSSNSGVSSSSEDDEEEEASAGNKSGGTSVLAAMMAESASASPGTTAQQMQYEVEKQPNNMKEDQKNEQPDNNTTTASASSSSTSTPPSNTAPAETAASESTTESSTSAVLTQQPEGWRVKLYRLNADGSWDDCGTGRITCIYHHKQQQQGSRGNGTTTAPSDVPSVTPKTAALPVTSPPSSSGGLDQWLHQETGEASLCVQAELSKQNKASRVLLRTRILLTDSYQRQGDNIITWCEPSYAGAAAQMQQQQDQQGSKNNDNTNSAAATQSGVDLALSFQDNSGCLDIWRQITNVQTKAADLFRQLPTIEQQQHLNKSQQGGSGSDSSSPAMAVTLTTSVEDMAAQLAAQHHAELQQQTQQSRQQQQEPLWTLSSDDGSGTASRTEHAGVLTNDNHPTSMSFLSSGMEGTTSLHPSLPNPPSLSNLEEIADTIAALQHVQQRESLAMWIAAEECSYLKALLALFPAAETRGDYGKLATLAACVKTVLLLNDPSILELIVKTAVIFEQVCSCLEYDPDLREKANHRWFLRERVKFRTVVYMRDPDLVSAIHRSFRVNYLRDTLLRPTMDESSLSTLSSLQAFTHADVVKGVTTSGIPISDDNNMECQQEEDIVVSLEDSYLARVIRMLGLELHTLSIQEWAEIEALPISETTTEAATGLVTVDFGGFASEQEQEENHPLERVAGTSTWEQYLVPQDFSLQSRRLRRRGCLSFLGELFNMVRISLQQQRDKDEIFSVLCSMEIGLRQTNRDDETNQPQHCAEENISDNVSQTSQIVEVGSVASTVRSERVENSHENGHETKSKAVVQEEAVNYNSETGGIEKSENPASSTPPPPVVSLLSLFASILSDPWIDVTEKGSVLEMIGGIALHDADLIRRHCVEYHQAAQKEQTKLEDQLEQQETGRAWWKQVVDRPRPNDRKQVVFFCPAYDLLGSLLFLLGVETDAGVLLQVSEVLRYILDTSETMGADHGGHPDFVDEADEVIPPLNAAGGGVSQNPPHKSSDNLQLDHHQSTVQKQFLSLFYEHYVEWLAIPFQCTILHPVRRVPDSILASSTTNAQESSYSPLFRRMTATFRKSVSRNDPLLKTVPASAIRSSSAVELMSFCVRKNLYHMKYFLLRGRVLGSVLKLPLLRSSSENKTNDPPTIFSVSTGGDRCLKLASLRLLRAILDLDDDSYNRHIIQNNLFQPVFEALRANPVGDNLVSSAIVEICDFIHTKNIAPLLEYIVTKHLSTTSDNGLKDSLVKLPSLEDVSGPYVNTLTVLRKAYEDNINKKEKMQQDRLASEAGLQKPSSAEEGESNYFGDHRTNPPPQHARRILTGRALEDQRKFRKLDEEESYFEDDECIKPPQATQNTNATGNQSLTKINNSLSAAAVDKFDAVGVSVIKGREGDSGLPRTPRMFSLAQAPSLEDTDTNDNCGRRSKDEMSD